MNLKRKRYHIIPDRIDLQVEILPLPFDDMASAPEGESAAAIRDRVVKARQIQKVIPFISAIT